MWPKTNQERVWRSGKRASYAMQTLGEQVRYPAHPVIRMRPRSRDSFQVHTADGYRIERT